jgi:hypothetical protein
MEAEYSEKHLLVSHKQFADQVKARNSLCDKVQLMNFCDL